MTPYSLAAIYLVICAIQISIFNRHFLNFYKDCFASKKSILVCLTQYAQFILMLTIVSCWCVFHYDVTVWQKVYISTSVLAADNGHDMIGS